MGSLGMAGGTSRQRGRGGRSGGGGRRGDFEAHGGIYEARNGTSGAGRGGGAGDGRAAVAVDGGRGSAGGGGSRGRGGGWGGPAAGGRPAVPVPKEDFNFEEALSKFDKEKALEVRQGIYSIIV